MGVAHARVANKKFTVAQVIRLAPSSRAKEGETKLCVYFTMLIVILVKPFMMSVLETRVNALCKIFLVCFKYAMLINKSFLFA